MAKHAMTTKQKKDTAESIFTSIDNMDSEAFIKSMKSSNIRFESRKTMFRGTSKLSVKNEHGNTIIQYLRKKALEKLEDTAIEKQKFDLFVEEINKKINTIPQVNIAGDYFKAPKSTRKANKITLSRAPLPENKEDLIIDLYDSVTDLDPYGFIEAAKELGAKIHDDGSIKLRSQIIRNGLDGTIQEHFKKIIDDISNQFSDNCNDIDDGSYETTKIEEVNNFVDIVNAEMKAEMFKIPKKSLLTRQESYSY